MLPLIMQPRLISVQNRPTKGTRNFMCSTMTDHGQASDKTALMRLVMRQAAIPVVGGIFAGVALAFGATRWIGSLLYETKATDPSVILGSIAALLVAAFLAALLPARRAALIDPMKTLRME